MRVLLWPFIKAISMAIVYLTWTWDALKPLIALLRGLV